MPNILKGTELFQRQQGHYPQSFPMSSSVVQGAVRRGIQPRRAANHNLHNTEVQVMATGESIRSPLAAYAPPIVGRRGGRA